MILSFIASDRAVSMLKENICNVVVTVDSAMPTVELWLCSEKASYRIVTSQEGLAQIKDSTSTEVLVNSVEDLS